MLGTDATFNYDPTKIIVSVKDLGITSTKLKYGLESNITLK